MLSCYICFVYPFEQSNSSAMLVVVLRILDYYLKEHLTSIDELNHSGDNIVGSHEM